MNMFRQFVSAAVMLVVLTVITGLIYPLAMTGVAQAVFPDQANGSVIIMYLIPLTEPTGR